MSDDVFTPETEHNAPARCARCDALINARTAMEAPTEYEDVMELVCLLCFVIPTPGASPEETDSE